MNSPRLRSDSSSQRCAFSMMRMNAGFGLAPNDFLQ
jgi:hypothetical protein